MKKLILVVALLLSACGQSPTGAVIEEPIEIGVISSLTGKAANYGQNVKDGVTLAVEEINNEGGIGGRRLVALYQDEQCDPKIGVSTAHKLIVTDGVSAVVGPMCSSVTVAAAPLFEKNRVVMIAPVASAPSLKHAGDYVFRNSLSTEKHSQNLAKFVRSLGHDSAAILYINAENGVGYLDGFTVAFEELSGTIVGSEAYERETTDFRTQLVKISEDEPDVIFIAGQVSIGRILRQMAELDINPIVIGISAMENPEVPETAANAAEGVFYTYSAFDPDAPELAEYQKAYEERYEKKSDWFAANAYDATKLIAEGLRRCGENSACIKDYLYTVEDYPGMGGVTTFDEFGEVDKPLMIKTIRNGEFEVY